MKAPTYNEAIVRLEQITRSIEEGTMDIDALSTNLKEAQELLKLCKEKLQKVEKDVNEVLEVSNN